MKKTLKKQKAKVSPKFTFINTSSDGRVVAIGTDGNAYWYAKDFELVQNDDGSTSQKCTRQYWLKYEDLPKQ